MDINDKETMKVSGIVRVYSSPAGKNQWKLESETKNLIMTAANVGRDLLVQWLLGYANYLTAGTTSANLNGTNTYAWATYDGVSTYTMTASITLDNLVIQPGFNLVTSGFTMTVTSTPVPDGINWGAIGTSATAVTSTDTQLGAETNRTSPSFVQDSSFNEAIIQFYFTDAQLTNGTYYEFGTFVNGTNTANSGQIFNHALFGTPYAKVTGQDTTVEVDITIS